MLMGYRSVMACVLKNQAPGYDNGMSVDEKTILVVEDETSLAEILLDYLQSNGFQTIHFAEGNGVTEHVRDQRPDLILLDLMLPGKDGMTICKEIRQFSSVPIIMMTARVEEIDRLLGLELGADDYVCKPYSPRELVARVKAVLRRNDPNISARQNRHGLVIDEEGLTAQINGEALDLTPVEFRLLKTLSARVGRVYSRDQLLDQLYDDRRVVTHRTVDTHVKNLRHKIQEKINGQDIIHSVYGVGYKLEWE